MILLFGRWLFAVLIVGWLCEVAVCFVCFTWARTLCVCVCWLVLALFFGFWLSLFDYVWLVCDCLCCIVVYCRFHLLRICCWMVALLFAFCYCGGMG